MKLSLPKKESLVIAILIFLVIASLYYLAYQFLAITAPYNKLTSVGMISIDGIDIEVLDDNKENPVTQIDWGTLDISGQCPQQGSPWHTYRLWFFTPDAIDLTLIIQWNHSAPDYLETEIFFERTAGTWLRWNPYSPKILSLWLHLDIRLRAFWKANTTYPLEFFYEYMFSRI